MPSEITRVNGSTMNRSRHQASPLIQYALRGLRSCWMPDHGRWSHIYHLDGRAQVNESVPESDVFYTLNVLLGFSRISHLDINRDFDLRDTFDRNVSLLLKLNSPIYAYGMALWAGAELGFDIEEKARATILDFVSNEKLWEIFRAQDLGMVLIGCVEQARRSTTGKWTSIANELFRYLTMRYTCSGSLFLDTATGFRRAFSSFATNLYLALACYVYGDWCGSQTALMLAKSCTLKLIELQGPQGEWPWFFYSPGNRVVDFYEVYSVHQTGMAPALLERAEQHNVPGATEALVKGFEWIFGQNQMKQSMLRQQEGLIIRSQVRKGELYTKRRRVIRSIANVITRRPAWLSPVTELELRLECRSYELGWILWSFGQRNDLRQIQWHPDLISARFVSP